MSRTVSGTDSISEQATSEELVEHLSDYFNGLLELKDEIEEQEAHLNKLKGRLNEQKNAIYSVVPPSRITDTSVFEDSILRCHGHKFYIRNFVVQQIKTDPSLDLESVVRDKA